ncbi:interferon lambda receptor 1 [Centropristis striata]|uniref:interferon lambda receptor 1 n=1 Tax=Centropristis striata TaxID=184440 RepID=UPI0027DFB8F6|nr:interferon lambda receptor 1 [Centropristis striata]
MKMWSMKVIILLLFCYACLATGNERAHFESRNFFNILHWDPVEPSFPGEKVLYRVQYWSDLKEEDGFRIKEECQNITSLSCNLTLDTPSVFDVRYRAQVCYNVSTCFRTTTFKPIARTTLGPPILSTYTTASSLHVDVTLPLGPYGESLADIITRSKKGPYKSVPVYTLHITHPKWAEQVNMTESSQFVINLKNNGTEYCGYVVYKPFAEWGRKESEKATFCVTLPDDSLMPWLLGTAALLTAIIIMSVVCMWKYVKVGKEKSMPELLVKFPSSQTGVLKSPDRNLIISKPEFCVQNEKTIYATIQVKPFKPPVGPGGYSPQDIACSDWEDSTGSSVATGPHSATSNPQDTSNQSSEIYSLVTVHVPAEHNEVLQQAPSGRRETSNPPLCSSGESWDKGGSGPKLTSHGVKPLPDPEPCESDPAGPLLLRTERDTNGQLVLPSFTFQLQSGTDDTISPLNSERKPLLSDLIDSKKEGPLLASLQSFDGSEWSDSGLDDSSVHTPTQPYCNSNFSPSQPVTPYFQQSPPPSDAMFESGYKDNWIPATILGNPSKDSCEYNRTNYPWTWTCPRKEEEEGEANEGEERSRSYILGGWGLQIQDN